jgi:predicted transcriptional regulator
LYSKAKQRWSTIETDLRNEIKTSETRVNDIQSQLDKKQQEIEQILRDQHKLNNDHQIKIRQLENELDEQRRENVCKKTKNYFLIKYFLFIILECFKNGT